jgi:hypothetical protein
MTLLNILNEKIDIARCKGSSLVIAFDATNYAAPIVFTKPSPSHPEAFFVTVL